MLASPFLSPLSKGRIGAEIEIVEPLGVGLEQVFAKSMGRASAIYPHI
jgi:hypothetical protein